MHYSDSPCQLIWVLSRCRSSRWTRPTPDTWPAPSAFPLCAQYHLISSGLCVWFGTDTDNYWFTFWHSLILVTDTEPIMNMPFLKMAPSNYENSPPLSSSVVPIVVEAVEEYVRLTKGGTRQEDTTNDASIMGWNQTKIKRLFITFSHNHWNQFWAYFSRTEHYGTPGINDNILAWAPWSHCFFNFLMHFILFFQR